MIFSKKISPSRSLVSIINGIKIRLLTIIIPFTFPAQLTTFLHRLRGVNVGKGSKISRTVQIDDSRPDLVEIGKNVWITSGCQILCHQRDLSYYEIGKPVMDCPLIYSKVIIKNGAHIGIGAILMPGVTIGEGAIIGAGSIVTKDIPPYSIAVGNPARVIRTFKRNFNENMD
jgi:acetyltransferase-like isoleucine patch superfamily enzyme